MGKFPGDDLVGLTGERPAAPGHRDHRPPECAGKIAVEISKPGASVSPRHPRSLHPPNRWLPARPKSHQTLIPRQQDLFSSEMIATEQRTFATGRLEIFATAVLSIHGLTQVVEDPHFEIPERTCILTGDHQTPRQLDFLISVLRRKPQRAGASLIQAGL